MRKIITISIPEDLAQWMERRRRKDESLSSFVLKILRIFKERENPSNLFKRIEEIEEQKRELDEEMKEIEKEIAKFLERRIDEEGIRRIEEIKRREEEERKKEEEELKRTEEILNKLSIKKEIEEMIKEGMEFNSEWYAKKIEILRKEGIRPEELGTRKLMKYVRSRKKGREGKEERVRENEKE